MSATLSASACTMLAIVTVRYTGTPLRRAPSVMWPAPNRRTAVSTMYLSRLCGVVPDVTGYVAGKR